VRKLDIRPRFKADVLNARRNHRTIDWETLSFVLEELAAGREVPSLL